MGLLLAVTCFAAGILVGSRWQVYHTVADIVHTLQPGPFSKCADIYKGYPVSPVYQVEDIEPSKHFVPGLEHIKLHGYRQHGMRTFEVWMTSMAPGTATPIHQHNCNEAFLVLDGTLEAIIQKKDGTLVEAALRPNSTINVMPNARHQLRNNGQGLARLLVVNDNPPFEVVAFPSWDAPKGRKMSPMAWDAQCPSRVPDSMKHLVVGSGVAAAGSKAEL